MMTPWASNKQKQPFALVIGLDHVNGIQTARILADRGVAVIGVAKDPKHYCCRTRVCSRIVFTDTTSDALIDSLETLGPELGEKGVLFPCLDPQVLLVSRNRQRLEPWYHIILPDPDVVEMLMDKTSFYRYAQLNGFPIPRTLFMASSDDAEKAARELTFPCMIKPPLSGTPQWEQKSKLKAYLVSTPEEFLEVYRRYAALSDILIAQEWVVGPVSSLYSCNCYFDAASRPVVTFIARKLRQWPPQTGESCLGEECRNDQVLGESIRLFSAVDYRGLGYVEMKRDERTGKHYIIEPNVGRPTGRSPIAEAGGVELVYTMYCDAIGRPLPVKRIQHYGNVKWIYLRRDLQSALYHWRRGELTLSDWLRSLRGRKVDALFAWNDPGPFIGDLTRSVRLYLNRDERRKRDYSTPF
jgi:predicted ATP-grasp superfamily ATP-dependent carboligase